MNAERIQHDGRGMASQPFPTPFVAGLLGPLPLGQGSDRLYDLEHGPGETILDTDHDVAQGVRTEKPVMPVSE